jgi:hypothetical protein
MRYTADTFEAAKFLGNQAGRSNKFLRKIACMDTTNREIYSLLEMVKIAKNLSKEERQKIELAQKLIQHWGYGLFQMDVISHLSMISNVDEQVDEGR